MSSRFEHIEISEEVKEAIEKVNEQLELKPVITASMVCPTLAITMLSDHYSGGIILTWENDYKWKRTSISGDYNKYYVNPDNEFTNDNEQSKELK